MDNILTYTHDSDDRQQEEEVKKMFALTTSNAR